MPSALPLAVATKPYQLPLPMAVRSAAKCGARGVQFDLRDELVPQELTETGIRQLTHHLDELTLRLAPAVFPLRRPLYAAAQMDARIAAVGDAIQFAGRLKTRVLTLRIGPLPSEKEASLRRLLGDVLSDLVRLAERVGVTLGITTGPEPALEYVHLVESITTGRLGLDFDPCSCVAGGHSVAANFRELHKHIVHVQARDGVRDLVGQGTEVAVGSGVVNWLELLALFHEADYRGWLTAIRTQGSNPGLDVTRAVQYLQEIYT
jgi:L-ribulose-5-phosphate 3-epimerase